jgi:hypothetical protein
MNAYEEHLNNGSSCTLQAAVGICKEIESGCPRFGCHVALTGGTLYKEGGRKDLDLLFYRIRQVEDIDYDGLFLFLVSIGFSKPKGFGWIFKSKVDGINVDLFFPEEVGGEYNPEDNAKLKKDEAPLWIK